MHIRACLNTCIIHTYLHTYIRTYIICTYMYYNNINILYYSPAHSHHKNYLGIDKWTHRSWNCHTSDMLQFIWWQLSHTDIHTHTRVFSRRRKCIYTMAHRYIINNKKNIVYIYIYIYISFSIKHIRRHSCREMHDRIRQPPTHTHTHTHK